MKILKWAFALLLCAAQYTQAQDINYTGKQYDRHRVLVEDFTGQNCQYCPAARTYVEKSAEVFPDRVAIIAHYHYSSTTLQIDGNVALANSYGISSAPNVMVDRYANNCSDPTEVASLLPNDNGPVARRLQAKTWADISIEGSTFDPETRLLTVVVKGEVGKKLPDLRVDCVLTESGIVAYQSSGGSDYVHNDVCRAYIAGIHGEPMQLNEDGTFRHVFTYTVPAENPTKGYAHNDISKMQVVAFITSWDNYRYPTTADCPKDFTDSQVHNCVCAPLSSLPVEYVEPTPPSSEYTFTTVPEADATLEAFQTMTLTFEGPATTTLSNVKASQITLTDASGASVAKTSSRYVEKQQEGVYTIGFVPNGSAAFGENGTCLAGQYAVTIPAGLFTFTFDGLDDIKQNEEIKVPFTTTYTAEDPEEGIGYATVTDSRAGVTYTISGRKAVKAERGIVVQDGKKTINK